MKSILDHERVVFNTVAQLLGLRGFNYRTSGKKKAR